MEYTNSYSLKQETIITDNILEGQFCLHITGKSYAIPE